MPERREDATEVVQQVELLPPEPVLGTQRMVLLGQLDYETVEVDPAFAASVRDLGVVQPIVVIPTTGSARPSRYRVIAGRRRVIAAAAAGQLSIPAYVLPFGTSGMVAANAMLTENVHRRENPVTDLAAIRAMIGGGATLEQIGVALHIPLNVLRARMRLMSLSTDAREVLDDGLMSLSVAMRLARLPESQQQQVLSAWRATEAPTLTVRFVEEFLRGSRAEEALTLDIRGAQPVTREAVPITASDVRDVVMTITGTNENGDEVTHALPMRVPSLRETLAEVPEDEAARRVVLNVLTANYSAVRRAPLMVVATEERTEVIHGSFPFTIELGAMRYRLEGSPRYQEAIGVPLAGMSLPLPTGAMTAGGVAPDPSMSDEQVNADAAAIRAMTPIERIDFLFSEVIGLMEGASDADDAFAIQMGQWRESAILHLNRGGE